VVRGLAWLTRMQSTVRSTATPHPGRQWTEDGGRHKSSARATVPQADVHCPDRTGRRLSQEAGQHDLPLCHLAESSCRRSTGSGSFR
jgi:hypothetical protein